MTDHAGWQFSHVYVKVAKSADSLCNRVCRTPQGIRALARFYVVVFIPLFFGPYYADVRVGARSFAFSLFLAIFVSFAPLVSLSGCCCLILSTCCHFVLSGRCLHGLPALVSGCWRMF